MVAQEELTDHNSLRKAEMVGFKAGLLAAADMLQVSRASILLAAGEMTAQEMRSVKSILAWRERVIRSEAEAIKV